MKERTEDGRLVEVGPASKTYSAHCASRTGDWWQVIADHTGDLAFDVYPEPGVITQMRAQWLAATLTDLERGRT